MHVIKDEYGDSLVIEKYDAEDGEKRVYITFNTNKKIANDFLDDNEIAIDIPEEDYRKFIAAEWGGIIENK